MVEKEIEVKILGYSVDEYIQILGKIGATKVGEESQVNHRFLDIKTENDSYLRLRVVNDEATFTFKERKDNTNMRQNLEYSISIPDPKMFLTIMDKIGMKYSTEHKKRIKYKYKDIFFDIDKWDDEIYPYPYMEIEVNDEAELDEIVKKLGIEKKNISTKSIRELVLDYKYSL